MMIRLLTGAIYPSSSPAAMLILGLTLLSGCASWNPAALLQTSDTSLAADARSLAKTQVRLSRKAGEEAESRGDLETAIRHYEKARMFDPDGDSLHRRLAVLYDQTGNDSRAQACYADALVQTPEDADLLNDYGVFHLHRQRWQEAEHLFRRAVARQPGHQRAATNLGVALAQQGRLAESYDIFAQVVGPAAAYSNLGVLLARQGQVAESQQHFRQALALDPSLKPAQEFLARLDSPLPKPALHTQQLQPVQYAAPLD